MSEQTPSAANPSGISENAAGALAYLTVIPAVILLMVEPYSRNSYIRFHAWQCIFMTGAWIAIDILIFVFGRLMPLFFLFQFGLYPLVALAMLILWIMVLIKALNGERLKLPLVGHLAEQQANR